MNRYEALERECDGGYACCAVEHTEGCFTGEGEPDALKGAYVGALRDQLTGAVSLSGEQWERVLWWLHKPLPPGPAKALDESIIRAINAQRGQ